MIRKPILKYLPIMAWIAFMVSLFLIRDSIVAWNYNYFYKDQVRSTICSMMNHEVLKSDNCDDGKDFKNNNNQ